MVDRNDFARFRYSVVESDMNVFADKMSNVDWKNKGAFLHSPSIHQNVARCKT